MSIVFRTIKFSLQDIFRNFSLSSMTVLILLLMLLSVNTLIIVRVLTNESISAVKKQIDVSVYFAADATEKQINEVRTYIKSFPEVTSEEYLDKDKVIENFREVYKDNPQILASLEELGGNPLGPTLIIKTREPENYQKIIDALNIPEYQNVIEAKTFGDTQVAIERIHSITTQVERFSLVLTAFFALIAFIIIFNTVRVAIYTQRVEISIKRLVGATNWFIRGPYFFESLFFSILSIVLLYGIMYLALRFLDPYVSLIFEQHNLLTNYFYSHILALTGLQFGAVLLLTIVSSSLAMRRYLRV